jgi:hypothetical protein
LPYSDKENNTISLFFKVKSKIFELNLPILLGESTLPNFHHQSRFWPGVGLARPALFGNF